MLSFGLVESLVSSDPKLSSAALAAASALALAAASSASEEMGSSTEGGGAPFFANNYVIISRIYCILVATDDFKDSWNALKSSVVNDGLVVSGSSVPLVGILLLGG